MVKSQVCHLPHESPRRALTQNSQPRVAISVIKQHRFAGVGGSLEQATRQKSRKLWGLERGLRKEQVLLGGVTSGWGMSRTSSEKGSCGWISVSGGQGDLPACLKPWPPCPEPGTPGSPSTEEAWQQKFKAILGYIESLRLAWDT